MIRPLALLLAAWLAQPAATPTSPDDRLRERQSMVRAVDNMAEVAERGPRRLAPAVLDAMRKVPRHHFVPAQLAHVAYRNRPLPIGADQTISQPYIVALMTHLLEVEKDHRVLEIGTGSGYQAAILSELAGQVWSIEIVEPLARQAAARLFALGYGNVTVRAGDGYAGWPEHAPFDRIIVTAGAPHVPQPLIDQLKPGGRMVIPLSHGSAGEELMLITKDANGRIRRRSILPVRFVPLTRARQGGPSRQ